MRVHTYPGGYEEYLDKQTRTTSRKRKRQWASEADIAYVANLIVRRGYRTICGLCHGTRSGKEQRWMMKHLRLSGATNTGMVIGSELAPFGRFDPLTFKHDFNEVRPEWLGRFSFVYSNSFDHAFDPDKTIRTWSDQLHPKGVMILEHTEFHRRPTATDPVGGKIKDYRALFERNGFHRVDLMMYQAPGSAIMKRYFLIQPKRYFQQEVSSV